MSNFIINYATNRYGKSVRQQFNLFVEYVQGYLGKDIQIQVFPCKELEESRELLTLTKNVLSKIPEEKRTPEISALIQKLIENSQTNIESFILDEFGSLQDQDFKQVYHGKWVGDE